MSLRKIILVTCIFNLLSCANAQDIDSILNKWNKSVILKLRNQIDTAQEESLIISLNEEIEFWESTKLDGEQYDYEFKYFIDKYSYYFSENNIIIHYKNIHEKRIYVVENHSATVFLFNNGEWIIKKKNIITNECYNRIDLAMNEVNECADNYQCGWDKITVTKCKKDRFDLLFLFKLCKTHLNFLKELED